MEIQEAFKIVRALADGVGPKTGEVLSSESVYQNAQTARALNRALTALEYVEEKERNRHKLPGNAGKSWTRDEEQQVCEELRKGVDFHEIAKTHNRTVGSIIARLVKLGQINPNTSRHERHSGILWT